MPLEKDRKAGSWNSRMSQATCWQFSWGQRKGGSRARMGGRVGTTWKRGADARAQGAFYGGLRSLAFSGRQWGATEEPL